MKNQIQKNFDKASNTYDSVADTQLEIANDLIKFLLEKTNTFDFNKILDIGTGTGFIPAILFTHNSGAHYYLNDISEKMLATASQKLQHLKYSLLLGDIENSPQFLKEHYDLIVSNMSFQWMNNMRALIKNILNSSSVTAFTTLGNNTFNEISELYDSHDLLSPVKKYVDYSEFQILVKEETKNYHNTEVYFQEKEYYFSLENFSHYTNYIRDLGANINFNPNSSFNLRKLHRSSQSIKLNYHVFSAIIIKKHKS